MIRDILSGREAADIDIAVAGDALQITAEIADVTGGTFVLLDETNRIGRVVFNREQPGAYRYFDFSSLRGTIEQDLKERDFTINALAVDLNRFAGDPLCFGRLLRELVGIPIIDPCDGQTDLQRGIIRAISPRVFRADPVRLLRAVRLAAELDYTIEKETEQLIRNEAVLVSGVAGERVHEELLKLLAVHGSAGFLRYLDELKLLNVLIPELEPARETTQPKEHHWKVLDHSLNTAVAVEYLLHRGNWLYPDKEILSSVPWSVELDKHFNIGVSAGSTRTSLLIFAGVLHDIAKPQTKTVTEGNKMRFLGHDRDGAAAVVPILERMRFSSREIKYITSCIRYHLRPTQLSQGELPSKRALYRYFRDTDDNAVDILFFSLADHLATRGPDLNLPLWREHNKLIEYVLFQFYKTEELVSPPKLIDGHDLINLFDLKPGPDIGRLLDAVREAHAAGEISNRDQALEYIHQVLKR